MESWPQDAPGRVAAAGVRWWQRGAIYQIYPRSFADMEYTMLQLVRCWICAGVQKGDVCHVSFPFGVHPAGQLWARSANHAGVGVMWAGSGANTPSQVQLERVRSYIRKGMEEGAELLTGGPDRPEGVEGKMRGGYFVKPTVFGKVKNSMTIAQEEIFGPVLAIIPYRDEEEAVKIANDTPYGLTNYVQSGDGARRNRMARRLRAGMIEMNGKSRGAGSPFGGMKATGNGHREAGRAALDVYSEWKSIYVDYSGRLQRAQMDTDGTTAP